MVFIMHIYKNRYDGKTMRFIYKYPKNSKSDGFQFTHFCRECSKCISYRNIANDKFVFTDTKIITSIGVFIRNLFLPIDNKIIEIPSMDGSIIAPDYYEYKIKNHEDWWIISRKLLGNGNKMYELAEYNACTIKDNLRAGDILYIPYYLICSNYRRNVDRY